MPFTVAQDVRRAVYDHAVLTGHLPACASVADTLGRTLAEVSATFQEMAAAHMLVLQPENGEILMANPFSAVPTPFPVYAGGREYFGNCIWDAFGIPAMLGQDAVIKTSCACCGSAVDVRVRGGEIEAPANLAHFALPAARWWDDIVFN